MGIVKREYPSMSRDPRVTLKIDATSRGTGELVVRPAQFSMEVATH